MATFKEIQQQIQVLQNRAEILNHLIDYVEENYRPNGGAPKNFLLKEDKTVVPDDAFESVVKEMLEEVSGITENLDGLLGLEVPTTKK